MNRGTILNLVFNQCREQAIVGNIGELLIQAVDSNSLAKRRSIFIAGVNQQQLNEIEQNSNDHLRNNGIYIATTYLHGTADQPSYNTQAISLTDNKLENNWRCRLIQRDQIDFTEEHQFNNLVMKSVWRIIVTKRDGEYFVRRDIHPFLWSPGYSVSGFDQFGQQVRKELDYLNDRQRPIDELNDHVRGFAARHGEAFQEVGMEFQINELRNGFNRHTDQLLEAFADYFA